MSDLINKMAADIRAMWITARHDFESRTGHVTHWGSGHMPKWDGGVTSSGQKCKPIWPKIAAFCLKHDLEPDVLIDSIFRFRKGGIAPNPNVACGQYALNCYSQYMSPEAEQARVSTMSVDFEAQKTRAMTAIDSLKFRFNYPTETTWKLVLYDEKQPLSFLFRYCLARSENLDDVAKEFHERALAQYATSPKDYDRIWGDWIPEELKQDAIVALTAARNVIDEESDDTE